MSGPCHTRIFWIFSDIHHWKPLSSFKGLFDNCLLNVNDSQAHPVFWNFTGWFHENPWLFYLKIKACLPQSNIYPIIPFFFFNWMQDPYIEILKCLLTFSLRETQARLYQNSNLLLLSLPLPSVLVKSSPGIVIQGSDLSVVFPSSPQPP